MIYFESHKHFWGGSSERVASQNRFPDGSLKLEIGELYNINDVINVEKYIADYKNKTYNITWLYDGDDEIFSLMCLVDVLRRNGYDNLSLTVPYLPHARMDRIHEPSENFSLKVLCDTINRMNFESVEVLDVHSYVSEALLNNVRSVMTDNWPKLAKDFDVVVFPDEGACKRYSRHPGAAGKKIAFGIKKRDWSTGKIISLDIIGDDIEGKKCLIVDDICSRGGTFMMTAEALKKRGAESVSLYVTHCENTILKGDLLQKNSPVDMVYTTNTILTDRDALLSPKIKIVDEYRVIPTDIRDMIEDRENYKIPVQY